MSLNAKELGEVRSCLERLFDLTPGCVPDRHRRQIREFIDVGEYGLATDELAASFLESGQAIPHNVARLVEQLADTMGLTDSDEHAAVAALRAHVH
jgi:Cu2+-containing amine oxidase